MRRLYVYILASKSGVLYVGVTNDVRRRVAEHRTARFGFTAAYRVHRLVYFESIEGPRTAIAREKQLKRWTRGRKLALIRSANPKWADLASGWFGGSGAGARPPSSSPPPPPPPPSS